MRGNLKMMWGRVGNELEWSRSNDLESCGDHDQ